MKLAEGRGTRVNHLTLLKEAWSSWSAHKCARLGAALAYYTIFSLAPLLIILFGVVEMTLGHMAPQQLMRWIEQYVGPRPAEAIAELITQSGNHDSGLIPTIVGAAAMLLGAAGLFAALRDALNTIWEAPPRVGVGWRGMVADRLPSFVLVVLSAGVLLVSLAATAVIQGMSHHVSSRLPMPGWVLEVIDLLVSLCVVTLLFALLYRVLPDVALRWSDLWVGAAFTSLLFLVGKLALGAYLGRSSVGSAYGAAGSLVVLLMWIYYAAQIFLFGAEYTRAYARRRGSLASTGLGGTSVPDTGP